MANMLYDEEDDNDYQPHAVYDASANGSVMTPTYEAVGYDASIEQEPQPQQAELALALAIAARSNRPQLNEVATGPVYQQRAGAMCTRSTSFIETKAPRHLSGQMYVECLEPLVVVEPLAIILVHGDFHTGQIWMTKPDGNPGWASFFCHRGHRVYVVDLPPFGRSRVDVRSPERARVFTPMAKLDEDTVERELTAPGRQEPECWATAQLHTQWPGTGQRGDPMFKNYCASLVPLQLKKTERQTLAQDALNRLLDRTGKAVLIGEGSGATMAWLAADLRPDMVAAVVAVEPAGPPAGTAISVVEDGTRRYSRQIQYAPGVRPYGLAEIPLTYDPPVEIPDLTYGHAARGLEMMTASWPDRTCVLQLSGGSTEPAGSVESPGSGHDAAVRPRKLTNLCKMKHAIVTAQASSHSTYDWATAHFLRQAGATVLNVALAEYNIYGNGHLMFLESNSDEIASLVSVWIDFNTKDEQVQLP